MKLLQKLILPLLLLLVIFIIYKFYFAKSGLSSFDDLDPNNTAVKELHVRLLVERGITQQGDEVIFYAADKNAKVMMISGQLRLPEGFNKADIIIIKGHLNGNSFHTHEVEID